MKRCHCITKNIYILLIQIFIRRYSGEFKNLMLRKASFTRLHVYFACNLIILILIQKISTRKPNILSSSRASARTFRPNRQTRNFFDSKLDASLIFTERLFIVKDCLINLLRNYQIYCLIQ